MSTERNLEETVSDCEIDTPTLPPAHEMFSSSAPLMICNTKPDGVEYYQMVAPPNAEVPKPNPSEENKID